MIHSKAPVIFTHSYFYTISENINSIKRQKSLNVILKTILTHSLSDTAFPVAQLVKNPPAIQETWVCSLGWEDALEKGKPTHSSLLAWRIPWTIESMGSQKVGHD